MTVYVDDMEAKFGRMVLCHMIADTDEELHAMAAKIGVARKWHQAPPKHYSHYDICKSMRARAVQLGAVEITWRQASAMCSNRAAIGQLGSPDSALAIFLAIKKMPRGPNGQVIMWDYEGSFSTESLRKFLLSANMAKDATIAAESTTKESE